MKDSIKNPDQRKSLEESLKDKYLVKLIGGLGKRFGYDTCYVAILDHTWVCGGGLSPKKAREDSIMRGVSTPLVLDVEKYFDRKFWPNIRLGYNPWTGKHVLEKREYARTNQKKVPSLHYQV